MTLIEIMVVITLLGMVAAAVGVSASRAHHDGQVSAARTQCFELAKAVQTFRVMHGRLPDNTQGLAVLTQTDRGAPLLERLPTDPWGNPYSYVVPGVHHTHGFDVRSRGPDAVEGGGDDVGNWPADEVAP